MIALDRRPWLAMTALATILSVSACSAPETSETSTSDVEIASDGIGNVSAVNPGAWPQLTPPALDPEVEARVTDIMSKMTLEQKIGQVIQADSNSVTPEEVKKYRLGSILSGGNSAPGDEPYADAQSWLEAADAYFEASVDPDGVEIAIPLIWGIDAVHGHANLTGATVFPHNIGLGAANDPDLIQEIMEVTAAELIVSGHDWTFAPTLAVPRDDRWGRSYEGFSENPELVASYADRIVFGLQGKPGTDSFFSETHVISTAKHFLGDGGTTNGIDQGDTAITEAELRDIHATPYFSAIEADVKSVMASFNSWNGKKMHGYEAMLTDVLKDQMGFTGFVVGDWNGHGQLPGCTNTDCPESFVAGVDMYMAPDSWQGIYYSLLAAVQSGEVPMERLDDAVRRILRVKVQAGIFEKPKPSERAGAGSTSLLGSEAHRDVARRAVRQSLVLLKNNNDTLPLDAGQTVLVIGDGADSISKQSGGWTLSWQGGGYANEDFPNGESILDGIREVVEQDGGTVIFDPTGDSTETADVVIAVYGEDPYAEFQGDLNHLDFKPQGFDPEKLSAFRDRGMPVVSVFLSGRPLWTNPEINASDAFVAAWLPGTEGGGLADILFQTEPEFDFTGRLSFSWPALATDFENNVSVTDYAPLFPFGYGLSYTSDAPNMEQLSIDNGLSDSELVDAGSVFRRGQTTTPWRTFLASRDEWVIFTGTAANLDGLSAKRADHLAQEDGILLTTSRSDAGLAFLPERESVDWSKELAAGKAIALALSTSKSTTLTVGLNCDDAIECDASQSVDLEAGNWREVQIPLSCFAASMDLSDIRRSIILTADTITELGIADVRLVNPASTEQSCSGN